MLGLLSSQSEPPQDKAIKPQHQRLVLTASATSASTAVLRTGHRPLRNIAQTLTSDAVPEVLDRFVQTIFARLAPNAIRW